jgi:hypothetical protein
MRCVRAKVIPSNKKKGRKMKKKGKKYKVKQSLTKINTKGVQY